MKKKNQRLLGIAGLLVILNLVFFTSSTGTFSRSNSPGIAVQDTSKVTAVILKRESTQNTLERSDVGWKLNQTYDTDPSYTRILLAVLHRVAMKRTLGAPQLEELKTRVEKDAVFVELEGIDRSFYVLGNRTLTKTYVLEAGLNRGYEVEIPGYRDFVGGIFQLSADQWRDRLIFRGNFRTIQQVQLKEGNQVVLDAALKDQFFEIAGLAAYDTTALVNYLNSFNYLQANERISPGKYPRYDSLRATDSNHTLILQDLGLIEPLTLEVYPALSGENFQLVVVNDEELTVFAQGRIKNWLKNAADFSVDNAD